MKNFKNDHWSDNFNLENIEKEKLLEFSEELIDDSHNALKKFYQEDCKKEKSLKRKQAWQ